MNDNMRAALVAAALKGVRQIKGHLHDGQGGHCAWGVYHLALHNQNEKGAVECHNTVDQKCASFWREYLSDIEIQKANDEKGWDFLTIARKC